MTGNGSSFSMLEVSDDFLIRSMLIKDIVGFHEYRADEHVAKYQSWSNFSFDDANSFVQNQINRVPNIPGEWIQLAIVLRDSGDIVGDCAFSSEEYQPEIVHIGVTISPKYQQRNVAFKAINVLLYYLFHTLGKHRVIATVDARNVASIALFRKLKFREEGHFVENVFFKGEWGSEVQFAMLQREWIALNQFTLM